ncbi:MAG: hypothetical protein LBR75_04705 [Prevotellaceae bacterium]|jgi:hypothetical protein|nr:hypothetical protein [Prevotellaceae bacterium]
MEFNLDTFFFDTPIYTKVHITDVEQDEFNCLFYSTYNQDVEGYNPWQKVQSTFQITRKLLDDNNNIKGKGGFGTIGLTCKRYHDEFRFYCYWEPREKWIIKVGQFPTVADFHITNIKQYKKLLPQEKLNEFTRAIGLSAHGVGIGSFVYLRRIFEYLISQAYEKAKLENTLSETDFSKARMDEKIDVLKSYLPNFLVENKTMYSILSLGIHELDENTCLAHFETLKVGIEIILDEQLDELRKKEKIELAKKKLTELKGEIKK